MGIELINKKTNLDLSTNQIEVLVNGKEEQEKTIDIVANGNYIVEPDDKAVLSKVNVNVEIEDNSLDEIEKIIDDSEVLEDTEGTVEEKVEQLIDKADWENAWYKASENMISAQKLFQNLEGYPTIPRTHFINCTNMGSMCENAKIEYVDYIITSQTRFQCDRLFFGSSVKRIAGVKPCGTWYRVASMFQVSDIEVIDEPFDFTGIGVPSTLVNAFYCEHLREVRFVENGIPASMGFQSAKLSAESIQSIIDGLATVETAQTLTLKSAITLTDEQKATIYNKGWTLAQ